MVAKNKTGRKQKAKPAVAKVASQLQKEFADTWKQVGQIAESTPTDDRHLQTLKIMAQVVVDIRRVTRGIWENQKLLYDRINELEVRLFGPEKPT